MTTGVLPLLAGVTLLVWSIRFIRDQVMSVFADRLRSALRRTSKSSLLASLIGILIAAALQSGTAAALLVTAFAERGFLSASAAVAAVFGADLGSALVVQILSLRVTSLAPFLIFIGGSLALGLFRQSFKAMGTILFGFGLVLYALAIITTALSGVVNEPLFLILVKHIANEPFIILMISIIFTLILHSSVAMILALSALGSTGVVSNDICFYFVMGTNIGSSLIPILLSIREGPSTHRILVANLISRTVLASICIAGSIFWPLIVMDWTSNTARYVIDVHLFFNFIVFGLGLLIARPLTITLEKIWPKTSDYEGGISVQHLDEKGLESPSLALASVAREALRIADRVERMLEAAMRYFKYHDKVSESELRTLDDEVDYLQEEIKLYLARLGSQQLGFEDRARAFELILFTTNLEHAGDIIDKSLVPLARKQKRLAVRFSEEGWREIKQMHASVREQFQLAITLFFTRDLDQARLLVARKDEIREQEREAMRAHLERLERGTPETIATSALHLDILRDLKRISAHLTAIAYPLLEKSDQILGTRLRVVTQKESRL